MNVNIFELHPGAASRIRTRSARLFPSFWMAGYECCSAVHDLGHRLDLLATTQHDRRVEGDYALLHPFNISTVREGIRWHLIERTPGRFNWRTVLPFIRAGQRQGISQIWDVCHYGWPDDLDALRPAFVHRFAEFSRAFAHFLGEESDGPYFLAPINEISFLSFMAGEVGAFRSHAHTDAYTGRGSELKLNLVRAAIEGCEAIWSELPQARIVHTDPLIRVLAPPDRPDLVPQARAEHEAQWEAWDMLTGRWHPELGGHPKYLDIIGVNYYWNNQWYTGTGQKLNWFDRTEYMPVHQLLVGAYRRYQRPLLIAETSHPREHRPYWISMIAKEVALAFGAGVDLQGICLYPIIDRPDWDAHTYHCPGLWDYPLCGDDPYERQLYEPYAEALCRAQRDLASLGYQ